MRVVIGQNQIKIEPASLGVIVARTRTLMTRDVIKPALQYISTGNLQVYGTHAKGGASVRSNIKICRDARTTETRTHRQVSISRVGLGREIEGDSVSTSGFVRRGRRVKFKYKL